MKLVVTPKPYFTESLMGYVLRLTDCNGYNTTSYVIHAMTGKWYSSKVGRLDASPLAELVGLDQAEVTRLSMVATTQSRTVFNIAGCELTAHDLRFDRCKICPKCLAESGHCDAFWDISHACACPKHGTGLVDTCPGCDKLLVWTRGKVCECRCGHDLSKIRAEPAPKAVLQLMAALRAATFQDASTAPLPQTMAHLSGLDLGQLCKLIWVMSDTLHRDRQGGRVVRNRSKLSSYLPEVAGALDDWPHGFRKFLERNYAPKLESVECLPAFRKEFAWALVRLSKNTEDGSDAYRFIAQEVFTFAAKYWTRSHLSSRGSMFEGIVLPEVMRWGSASECAQVMGLHMSMMKRDAQEQQFPYRLAVSPTSRRGKTYDLEWARTQQPKSDCRPLGVRQAARILGVSNGVIEVLRKRGHFERCRRLVNRNGVFNREEVDAFGKKIRAAVAQAPKVHHKGLPTIDVLCRRHNLSTDSKATLYEAILDGRIPVRGSAGKSPEQYQIDTGDVFSILVATVAERDEFISYIEARVKLACADAVLMGLARKGHLMRKRVRGRWRLVRSSVDEFDARYTLVSSVSRQLNRWSRSISTQARRIGIPVQEVKCDQYVALILDKRDVQNLEASFEGQLQPVG